MVLATHPLSCHPWRVFGTQESERKRRERGERREQNEKLRVCTERLKLGLENYKVFYIANLNV